nr:translation initiation factor IF-2-like [Aegilops tauschii subsp. strangulata]
MAVRGGASSSSATPSSHGIASALLHPGLGSLRVRPRGSAPRPAPAPRPAARLPVGASPPHFLYSLFRPAPCARMLLCPGDLASAVVRRRGSARAWRSCHWTTSVGWPLPCNFTGAPRPRGRQNQLRRLRWPPSARAGSAPGAVSALGRPGGGPALFPKLPPGRLPPELAPRLAPSRPSAVRVGGRPCPRSSRRVASTRRLRRLGSARAPAPRPPGLVPLPALGPTPLRLVPPSGSPAGSSSGRLRPPACWHICAPVADFP